MMDIEMDTDVSEGWSVVSHRDKQKGCNNVSTEEEMDSHKNDKSDQCLIGSFVYQTQPSSSVVSRTRPLACETTSSDRDLIGTPFFISQHSDAEVGVASGHAQKEGRGVLRLTPQLKMETQKEGRGVLRLTPQQKIEMENHRVPDFSLDSPSDWPGFPETITRTVSDQRSDGKSWSKVLKAPAPAKKPTVVETVQSGDSGSEEEAPTKKKKKKKKAQEGLITDKRPLMLELGALFDGLQVKSSGRKKVVFSTGSGLAVSKPTPTLHSQPAPADDAKVVPRGGNMLDSTAPQLRRGKEREQPKKRKPTPLRKIINKEKEKRKTNPTIEATNEESKDDSVDTAKDESEVHDTEATKKDTEEVDTEEVVPPPRKPGHNRRFRDYCTHVLTEEINECAAMLLSELLRFQDRQFLKDPIKAKMKKRYVCGMREVLKHVKSRRVKCLIVAPNMERIHSEGGIDDVIAQILSLAEEQSLPTIFALSRRRLAVTLKKSHKVGCVGVFRYEGAESHYKRLLELVENAREQYKIKEADLLTASHPPLPEASPGRELDSTTDALKGSPWGVFYNNTAQQTVPISSNTVPVTSSLPDFPTAYPHHSDHVTSSEGHETTPFNVLAKEFVPLFNVHAPEFCPEM
ncbi:selenocysteine insertion sequence-binding protein 2-like [Halichondria panicea]|uniref:selenocysteine insertion sequence-binding protein 2-like n=1 Tax=Halichondria panicea TaxID=6063 RepID=UPI00312B4A77